MGMILPRYTIPAVILGGSGYVAGELLRLLAFHPRIVPVGVLSESHAGEPVESVFPHLAGAYAGLDFILRDELHPMFPGLKAGIEGAPIAVFCAAPHGAAAGLLEAILDDIAAADMPAKAVDLSADFRYADATAYEKVYGHPHGAPALLGSFTCALPEHREETPAGHIAHPGCFTTAVLLATVPLLALDLIEPRVSVVATTGSTGAGKTPTATTHHPERRSNLYAYNPLRHRHEPEMRTLAAAASGKEVEIHFVPQAGPFARGIYATVQARLREPLSAAELHERISWHYRESSFVEVLEEGTPRLQDVVGTNLCRLGVAVDGDHVAVFSAIDNLVKGAAGGAIQWMNRLVGLSDYAGLRLPGLGWL